MKAVNCGCNGGRALFSINGTLEIDSERGVIYFHTVEEDAARMYGGPTIMRVCGLPKPIPVQMLDITWPRNVNWGHPVAQAFCPPERDISD